jgi:hypothetical protein
MRGGARKREGAGEEAGILGDQQIKGGRRQPLEELQPFILLGDEMLFVQCRAVGHRGFPVSVC